MTRSSRILLYSIAGLVLGLAGPASTLAKGPPIKVEQADPNFAVQEEQDKPIILKGKNLPGKAEVFFILNKAGDPNDGNTDQVVVVQSTVILNPDTGNLEFEINVAPEAILGDYDIEVIEMLSSGGGRKGKGTTLFSVQSKDNGGGTGSTLTATFCLNMIDENPGLASDGLLARDKTNDYCHDRKERVQVETGSHPGFRFDSNTKSRPPLRTVYITVAEPVRISDDDGKFLSTFESGEYNIDLRFNKADATGGNGGGLDLGEMLSPSFVPVNLWLESLDGKNNWFGLAYSENTPPLNDGRLEGNTCASDNTLDVQVKRLSAGSWSIESSGDSTACLWDLNADPSEQAGELVQIPFYFIITLK